MFKILRPFKANFMAIQEKILKYGFDKMKKMPIFAAHLSVHPPHFSAGCPPTENKLLTVMLPRNLFANANTTIWPVLPLQYKCIIYSTVLFENYNRTLKLK